MLPPLGSQLVEAAGKLGESVGLKELPASFATELDRPATTLATALDRPAKTLATTLNHGKFVAAATGALVGAVAPPAGAVLLRCLGFRADG